MRFNRRFTTYLLAGMLIVVPAGLAHSQQKESTPVPPEPVTALGSAPSSVLVASRDDYLVGPSDVIEVTVRDAPELSGSFTITAAGTFEMPFLGNISCGGKTPEQIRDIIVEGLRNGEYLKKPMVLVKVTQYNSHSYFIQGAVRSPGIYQIRGRASLVKLIIAAGGLAESHGSTAFIIRETRPASGEDNNQYDLIKANISGLLSGNFDQNLAIEPGDVVNIPPMNVFYVAGEVTAPGSFPLKEGTTVRQAISLARGTTFRAAGSRAVIFRDDLKSGKRIELKLNLPAVMSGKAEDLSILANDVIIVPNSRFKSVGGALLTAFGVSSAYRGGVIR